MSALRRGDGSAAAPALVALRRALDAAGVRWCLLRGEDDVAEVPDDVDILVAPRDAGRLAAAAASAGYVPMPAWGRGSHRFSVARVDGRWVKLDVVTELAFGRRQELVVAPAGACLTRIRTDRPMPSLDPDDACWALLLHCLLDKGEVPPRHAARLAELAPAATATGPVAAALPDRLVRDLLDATARSDWDAARRLAPPLRRALVRRAPLRATRRRAVNGVLARTTKVLVAVRRRGASVALLGPDGAGKSTLSAGLAEAHWYPVRTLYAGLYGKGTRPLLLPGLPGRLLRLWAVVARGAGHRLRGRVVVFDRYVYDARLPVPPGTGVVGRLRRWIVGHAAPPTDLVVLLDAPGELLFERKGEHDPATLEAQRAGYRRVVERLANAVVVDATRPAHDVVEDVVQALWRTEARRRGAPA